MSPLHYSCVNGAPGTGLCTISMAIHSDPVCILKPPWQKSIVNMFHLLCSTSIIITEMQIKTTMKYHFTLVRMVITKKSTNNKCWRGCGGKKIFLHCLWECKSMQPQWKTYWSSLNTKNKIMIRSINSTIGHISGKYLNSNLKRYMQYDTAIPLLGIYPEKIIIWKAQCSLQHYLHQPGHGNNLNDHQPEEWTKNIWNIYKMEYYSA